MVRQDSKGSSKRKIKPHMTSFPLSWPHLLLRLEFLFLQLLTTDEPSASATIRAALLHSTQQQLQFRPPLPLWRTGGTQQAALLVVRTGLLLLGLAVEPP